MIATIPHRVRYHEVDQQGFLFNGRYFEIADVAMTEFFRALGWSYAELNGRGVDPSVVHVDADFLAPASFDDVLDVSIRCDRVGSASFRLHTTVAVGARTVAELGITYANVDARLRTSTSLPDTVADALRTAAATRRGPDDEKETS